MARREHRLALADSVQLSSELVIASDSQHYIFCKMAEFFFLLIDVSLSRRILLCLGIGFNRHDISSSERLFRYTSWLLRSDILQHVCVVFSCLSSLIISWKIKNGWERFEARSRLIQTALRRRSARCIRLLFQAVFNLLLSLSQPYRAIVESASCSRINKRSTYGRCAYWICEWKVLILAICFTTCVFVVCLLDTDISSCLSDISYFNFYLLFLSTFVEYYELKW